MCPLLFWRRCVPIARSGDNDVLFEFGTIWTEDRPTVYIGGHFFTLATNVGELYAGMKALAVPVFSSSQSMVVGVLV